MKYFKSGFLLILLFLFNCGVKQPVEMENGGQQTGSVFVESTPVMGAAIILDGQSTGLTTPDTIKNVSPGQHIVRVFLDGYQALQDSIPVEVEADQVARVTFQLQKIITSITLKINSDPAGATIFLDDQNTGKKTPDTLVTTPGSHKIRLEKNGFMINDTTIVTGQQEAFELHMNLSIIQRLLFESFANVSCVPCVPATENLLKFSEEHAAEHYVIIEYFANWPSPNDPFYKAASKDVDQRIGFYNVQTLPTLKLKGTVGIDAHNYDEIVSKYDQALAAQNSALGISIEKEFMDNQLRVRVELYDYGAYQADSDLRLFVAIAEDSIHFDNPPGSNGLKDFEWVFRGFLSDRQGDALDKASFDYVKDWPANWQYKGSKIVAFIQNIQNKQVLQTGVN